MKTHYFSSVRPFLFLVISSVIFMYSCSEKHEHAKNDLALMELKGRVRTLTEITYNGVDHLGKIQKGEMQSKRTYSFNEDGNIVEDGYFDSYLNLWNKSTFKYDDKGRLVERNRLNNDGEPMFKTSCIYDEKGRISERIGMNYLVRSQEKEIFKYDDDRNEVEMEFRSFGGVAPAVYYLDEVQAKTRREDSRKISNRYRKEIYSYDEMGNKTEEKHYTADGSLTTRSLYKFNGSGHLTETDVFDSEDTLIWKIISKYDLSGNEIERKSGDSDLNLEMVKSCKYDKMGFLIEEVFKYGNRISKSVNDYGRFDEKGNWTIRTRSYILDKTDKENVKNYNEREFEYY